MRNTANKIWISFKDKCISFIGCIKISNKNICIIVIGVAFYTIFILLFITDGASNLKRTRRNALVQQLFNYNTNVSREIYISNLTRSMSEIRQNATSSKNHNDRNQISPIGKAKHDAFKTYNSSWRRNKENIRSHESIPRVLSAEQYAEYMQLIGREFIVTIKYYPNIVLKNYPF